MCSPANASFQTMPQTTPHMSNPRHPSPLGRCSRRSWWARLCSSLPANTRHVCKLGPAPPTPHGRLRAKRQSVVCTFATVLALLRLASCCGCAHRVQFQRKPKRFGAQNALLAISSGLEVGALALSWISSSAVSNTAPKMPWCCAMPNARRATTNVQLGYDCRMNPCNVMIAWRPQRGGRGADIVRCGARKNYCKAASLAPRVPQVIRLCCRTIVS